MPEAKIVSIESLVPDDRNYNTGTERGQAMLRTSLQQYGAGRSILIDKYNRVVAGNQTLQSAAEIGLDDVIIVPSDGTKLVAVQREDLDLDSPEGRQLALIDNVASAVNLSWNAEELLNAHADGQIDLTRVFTSKEMKDLEKQTRPALDLLASDPTATDESAAPTEERTLQQRFPLAIVLDHEQLRRWQAWKKQANVKGDTDGLMRLLEMYGSEEGDT